MRLQSLIQEAIQTTIFSDHEINRIAANSKDVQSGDLFVAIPCADEAAHIHEALERGASYIIAEKEHHFPKNKLILVDNARYALARLCSCFYAERPAKLVAVTGTNGKSSVVSLVSQILSTLNIQTANIGTLGVHIPHHEEIQISAPSLTTYDPISMHRILQELKMHQIQCAAIEATSHGLHQYRLDGLQFQAVALTNITQDHLDYHGTMEAYAAAKMRLFLDLACEQGVAVLNQDSSYLPAFKESCARKSLKIITYSPHQPADLYAFNIRFDKTHSIFDLRVFDRTFSDIVFNIPGSFQIENLLCALGLVFGADPQITLDDILPLIPTLSSIPGRLEPIAEYHGGHIFVDFCHTPDAVEKVLINLRALNPHRLIIVLGCGGDRDPDKRPKMGAIASKLADEVIITDDNPRNEDPALIRSAILKGAPQAKEIAGRKKAITEAIAEIRKDDILLVAGRGHEAFQLLKGGAKIVCNDKDIILQAIHHFNDGFASHPQES